ncbi:hypothetical protein [Zoogloea sp.]|uniref:hypothetical protein n=1 Tax=Zoogloea sp. TaxID=49181 RepID=UPI0014157A7A|nr:MAG: hypothetical protein F9K15_12710 [Zoogloea sp.]
MNTVEIRLVINGKEAIATLELTDENVQKVAERLNVLGAKGGNSIDLLRQKAAMLTQLLENAELGSPQFNELATMTQSAYKELEAAEAQLTKVTGTSGNARMAVTAFSQTLSDSTQFQNGFRFGVMAISNNLEQMFSALGRVKAESAATGQSMTKTLASAMAGPGGVMIAISSVLLLLQILPQMFEENGEKVEEFSLETVHGTGTLSSYAQALQNVEKQLKELSVDEIKDKIIELDAQIQRSREKSVENIQSWTGQLKQFFNARYGTNFDITGGEAAQGALLQRSKDLANEELANRSRVKVLDDEISSLRDAQNKKGADARAIADEIEKKERERANLLKSTNERLDEQAAISIRIQRAQVDAMAEGYDKQRKAAEVSFNERKVQLDEELRTGVLNQQQYTQLLTAEEQKRDNAFRKAEQDKNEFSIKVRTEALKRMADAESSEMMSRLNLDERIALSKARTEEERLAITKDFAIKRIEAEAAAQAAILQIEREAIQAKIKNTPEGSREREELMAQLASTNAALASIQSTAQIKKTEILTGFKLDFAGISSSLDTIMGREEALAQAQRELTQATTQEQREAAKQRVDEHKKALDRMSYFEKDFARDVFAGISDVFSKYQQLQQQRVQQDAEAKLQFIEGEKEKELADLEAKRQEALSHAKTQLEKDAINKQYNANKLKAEQQAEAQSKAVKLEAFEAQKSISRTNAVISIAEAIVKTMASVPWPFSAPLAALAAAAGYMQLQIIEEAKPAFAGGGLVRGPGGPREDKVNAWLSDGEFVMNAEVTSKNRAAFEEINRRGLTVSDFASRMFATGGYVRSAADKALERTLLSVPTYSPKLPMMFSSESSREINTIPIEKKLDAVVEAISKMQFVLGIDGRELVTTIEEIQRVQAKREF